MIGAIRAAWVLLARPTILWPAVAAVLLFSVMSIAFTFATAAAPGGSRLTDPPIVLADLAASSTPALMVGRPVMILGLVVLAVAALHVAGQFASGFIRLQLIRQPRRRVWLAGTWTVLAGGAAVLSIVSAGVSVATAWICAIIWSVDTSQWLSGVPGVLQATGNLALGMVAFAIAGSALAVWLRSAVVTLSVALGYALFENLLNAAAPFGQGLLPAAAFSTVATSAATGGIYSQSLIASVVLLAVVMTGVGYLISQRDVTD